jgi:hypothetical protein
LYNPNKPFQLILYFQDEDDDDDEEEDDEEDDSVDPVSFTFPVTLRFSVTIR